MKIEKSRALVLTNKLRQIFIGRKKFFVPAILGTFLVAATFLYLSAPAAYANLSNNLAGKWNFDEGSGTTTADSSGHGITGTIAQSNGSPVWASPGRDGTGSSLAFNGTGPQATASSTVNLGNTAALDAMPTYILSMWVKFNPGYVGTCGGSGFANLIGRNSSVANWSYMLYMRNNGKLRVHHRQSDGAAKIYDSAATIPTGQWVNIAQVADGSRIRLYIDGVEDTNSSTQNANNTYDGTALSLPAANTYIGQDNRECAPNATIDDVRIYNPFGSPGGTYGGLMTWHKANDGVIANGSNQVTQWNDSSDGALVSSQARASQPSHTDAAVPSNDILLVNNGINFNPAVDFSGAFGKSLKGSTNTNWNSSAPLNIFAVSMPEGNSPGSLSGIFTTNGNWNSGTATGRGLLSTSSGSAYMLDGAGCSPGSTTSSTAGPHVARANYITTNNALNGKTWLDGKSEGTGTNCPSGPNGPNFEIGGRTGDAASVDNRIYNGKIAEVIAYKTSLTATQAQQIDSYLAIKYGITLNQTPALNYLSSTGGTIWNSTANSVYKNRITGIGRDDVSSLNQKQSRSQTPQGIVTIGHNIIANDNASNGNNFSTNNTFMMFGDDNNSATTWVGTGATNTILTNYQRLPRTWKTQETGTVGNVTLALDTADPDADVPAAISGYYLLRDSNNNGSFTDETPIPMSDAGGGQYSVGGIDLANGELFTFATFSNTYSVQVQVADNITSEAGKTGLFKVRLGARPTAPVTITLSSSDTNEGTAPASITIQPDDWNNFEANQVVVTGVNDSPPVGDGAVQYFINTDDVTSADPNFNALTGADVDNVLMYNLNDDPPGISDYAFGGNVTTEAGGCVTVRFELLSQPTAAVTIPLSLSDTTEGTLNGVTQITIQPANWNQPANNVVTICGLPDGITDGDVQYYLITGDPTSADPGYDAITADQVADIALVNTDVDKDDDGDGVKDSVEDAAPNSGDANDDGLQDSTQKNVASFISDATGNYATLQIDDVCQINIEGVAAESSQETTDIQYDYPHGLMNFQADCGLPGFVATVQQYFYGATENNLIARKYNSVTNTYFSIDGATVAQQTIGGTVLAKATFQITDGGQLDMNGNADGVIVDPAGLGILIASSSTSTPAAPSTGIASKLNLAVIAVATLLVAIILGASYRVVRTR